MSLVQATYAMVLAMELPMRTEAREEVLAAAIHWRAAPAVLEAMVY